MSTYICILTPFHKVIINVVNKNMTCFSPIIDAVFAAQCWRVWNSGGHRLPERDNGATYIQCKDSGRQVFLLCGCCRVWSTGRSWGSDDSYGVRYRYIVKYCEPSFIHKQKKNFRSFAWIDLIVNILNCNHVF